MSDDSETRLGGEKGYGEKLLNAAQRAEADAMIREVCSELGWPDLAERLLLPHRSGFIIYHFPGIAARALGQEPSPVAAAVMHVLTASFKMVDWLLDEEDWPQKSEEGVGARPTRRRPPPPLLCACSTGWTGTQRCGCPCGAIWRP